LTLRIYCIVCTLHLQLHLDFTRVRIETNTSGPAAYPTGTAFSSGTGKLPMGPSTKTNSPRQPLQTRPAGEIIRSIACVAQSRLSSQVIGSEMQKWPDSDGVTLMIECMLSQEPPFGSLVVSRARLSGILWYWHSGEEHSARNDSLMGWYLVMPC
jgi:hypothetical protein